MSKFQVLAVFGEQKCNYFDAFPHLLENGFEKAVQDRAFKNLDGDFAIREFSTQAEANAFIEGINLANGWEHADCYGKEICVNQFPLDDGMFHLSLADKFMLLKWGHPEEDFDQIERATNIATFETNTGKKVSWQTAKKILGSTEFLSGISRAAFHWTASRYNKSQTTRVSIDCSAFFN